MYYTVMLTRYVFLWAPRKSMSSHQRTVAAPRWLHADGRLPALPSNTTGQNLKRALDNPYTKADAVRRRGGGAVQALDLHALPDAPAAAEDHVDLEAPRADAAWTAGVEVAWSCTTMDRRIRQF